ncbi:MAG: transcription termination factor NusA [Alphaproteobacteria bacterium]|jgi:N utilization substance protein A|nr:transcription termination factor NusA [Alphaproteobacteria bacterium]
MLNRSNSNELQARPELIDIIENVSKDKGISIEEVFEAMEVAIKKIAVNKYGNLHDIRVKINRNNGSILIQKVLTVVEEVENSLQEVTLDEAKKIKSDAVLGDILIEILPQVNFDRNFVQPFRQIVTRRVKEAEKQKEFENYKDKIGEIVSGVVKRVELGNVFVELSNKAEAFMRRDNVIPRERLEVGDRIRALVVDVKEDIKSAQIVLSRTHPDFIKKLFAQEISEVYDEQIIIHSIARDAGSRSKVALYSNDTSIDPISTCVGFKGQRIQGILSELKGEKIDLIRYSDNIGNFVLNAFHASEVQKVIVDENKRSIEVVVNPEKLKLAIGRGGQNINLISQLIGWHIDLMDEETEKVKRQTEMAERVEYMKSALDIDDIISQLLVIEGFKTVEDIIEEKVARLSAIEAFNDDIIEELKNRAKDFIASRDKKYIEEMNALGITEELRNFEGLSKEMLVALGGEGVKTVNDLAELSTYDLLDILPKGSIDFKKAEGIIILARKIWEI